MSSEDADYFRLRAVEERAAAAAATLPSVAAIHETIAGKYETLVRLFEEGQFIEPDVKNSPVG